MGEERTSRQPDPGKRVVTGRKPSANRKAICSRRPLGYVRTLQHGTRASRKSGTATGLTPPSALVEWTPKMPQSNRVALSRDCSTGSARSSLSRLTDVDEFDGSSRMCGIGPSNSGGGVETRRAHSLDVLLSAAARLARAANRVHTKKAKKQNPAELRVNHDNGEAGGGLAPPGGPLRVTVANPRRFEAASPPGWT